MKSIPKSEVLNQIQLGSSLWSDRKSLIIQVVIDFSVQTIQIVSDNSRNRVCSSRLVHCYLNVFHL